MPKKKVLKAKSSIQMEFSGRRYQVQKRVYLDGEPVRNSSEAFGNEAKPRDARAIMTRLIGEEVQNNRQSEPRIEPLGENKAKVVCKSGLVICFAVVAITLPSR